MWWFKTRKPERSDALDEAEEAIQIAEKYLEKTMSRESEVAEVVTAMRLLRERNHFREQLEVIMGGPYESRP